MHIRKKPKTGDGRLLRDRPDRRERYSTLPWTVLIDSSLEPIDWGVFACLSSMAFESDTIQMGSRWIAETVRAKKGRVQASLGRLIAGGHVKIEVPAKGSRSPVYRLTSSVFARRQKVIMSDKSGNHTTTRYELERKIELARRLRAPERVA